MILYPKPSRHLTNMGFIYQVPHSAQLMNTLYPLLLCPVAWVWAGRSQSIFQTWNPRKVAQSTATHMVPPVMDNRSPRKASLFLFVSLLLFSRWVVSDSLQPHELHHARLLCPWDFPGKNTGVGCPFLLQGIFLPQGSNLHLLLHW